MNEPERIFLSPPDMSARERAHLEAAFASNFIAPVGPALNAFEAALRRHLDDQCEVVAVSSGTAALHLAFVALGLNEGDAAIVPTAGFAATAFAVRYTGARPVFADITRESWTLCPERAVEAIAKARAAGLRPKALVPVDLYGQSAHYQELRAIAQAEGLAIVQDAAEAVGARYNDQALGLQGDFAVYSFNGNKLLTTGGGGALLTRDPEAAKRLRKLAAQAREPVAAYVHREIGFNYRLPNLSAAIGLGQLERLDEILEKRRQNRLAYETAFADLPGVGFNPVGGAGRPTPRLTCLLRAPPAGPPPPAPLI
ncbi:MAG: DegT/DnrJ/EryC1/StrS family aminotransferase, partial [Opitutales bacterium]